MSANSLNLFRNAMTSVLSSLMCSVSRFWTMCLLFFSFRIGFYYHTMSIKRCMNLELGFEIYLTYLKG